MFMFKILSYSNWMSVFLTESHATDKTANSSAAAVTSSSVLNHQTEENTGQTW